MLCYALCTVMYNNNVAITMKMGNIINTKMIEVLLRCKTN